MPLFLTGHQCTVHIFSEFSCTGVFCNGNPFLVSFRQKGFSPSCRVKNTLLYNLERNPRVFKKTFGRPRRPFCCRSVTQHYGARPFVPHCRSPQCCNITLAQKQSRNEQPTDYGTKTRRKPTLLNRLPGAKVLR